MPDDIIITPASYVEYGRSDGFPVEVRFMSTTMEFQTWGWRK